MATDTTDWSALRETLSHLTLAEKLQLIEEVARSLRTASTAASPTEARAALNRLREELAALPLENPADGVSNRNHDDALYVESS